MLQLRSISRALQTVIAEVARKAPLNVTHGGSLSGIPRAHYSCTLQRIDATTGVGKKQGGPSKLGWYLGP